MRLLSKLRRGGEQPRDNRLRVLFLCTGNSCRSQMAEGWTRQLKNDVIEAYSAGTAPGALNHKAVEVMAEAGVDIRGHESKDITEFLKRDLDYVVTVCYHAHESCPTFNRPGVRVVHRGFPDPPLLEMQRGSSDEERLQVYREVRDEIRAFVEGMPDNLEQLANDDRKG